MPTLLGPPEVSNYNPKAPPEPTAVGPTTTIAKTSGFNTIINPPMGFTENFSPIFLSSGNPSLDFFFHIVPQPPDHTQAPNVPSFTEFGFFKDLPEILYRLLEGSHVRENQKVKWLCVKGSNKRNK
ncbi:hypothetical protein PIB30_084279 [Stylosanthes scabra]|uniref:Uncharacterized protein n=1 Tax=Stylosanthes scabra TaxID=79078 RepID=A0ABU6ZRA5_9FABA|nr:hypothetical protein [Stylosanthes scabra]